MTYRALKTYWRGCCLEAPCGVPSPIVSNHPSFICSYWLGICYQVSPKWSPPGKVPFHRDPDECWVGIQGQQARRKSQFLASPSSWVPWSPSEHPFLDIFIPPAAVATPAFPVSPHHLSSASACLLTPCVGCLWNTSPWWPPGFLPALLLHSCSA